jgi:hypothetical protein
MLSLTRHVGSGNNRRVLRSRRWLTSQRGKRRPEFQEINELEMSLARRGNRIVRCVFSTGLSPQSRVPKRGTVSDAGRRADVQVRVEMEVALEPRRRAADSDDRSREEGLHSNLTKHLRL